ncbi:MAG: hypothetical protein HY689_06885 [Chloroflexi bacterium]|nr:hypothetical protein [Chloroflexota bacterium]
MRQRSGVRAGAGVALLAVGFGFMGWSSVVAAYGPVAVLPSFVLASVGAVGILGGLVLLVG